MVWLGASPRKIRLQPRPNWAAAAAVWRQWLMLNDQQSELKAKLKTAEAELDKKAYALSPRVDLLKSLKGKTLVVVVAIDKVSRLP